MLEDILRHLNNWFLVGVYEGEFKVEDGSITLPFLLDGQYFRIVGSIFNDGLHQYQLGKMRDETFFGSIWALSIPPALISLTSEIESWREKNEAAVLSPYQSESFAGYTYTKRSGNGSAGELNGWQDAFRGRLNAWRKMKGVEP